MPMRDIAAERSACAPFDMHSKCVIVTFHGVGEPNRSISADEAAFWVDRARFISMLDMLRDHPTVRITFDDGNESDILIALPALQKRNLTATFFVLSGQLDRAGFLSSAAVNELAAAGMTIGLHGWSHRPWPSLDAAELCREFDHARAVLEDTLCAPVESAACPYGAYDRRVLTSLRSRHFMHVYTSDRGWARTDAWLQPRNTIMSHDDANSVARLLLDRESPGRSLMRQFRLMVKRLR